MNWKPKEKRCKQCKAKFMPYNPLQAHCSVNCVLEYNRTNQQSKEAKQWKEQRKKIVEKLKTLSDYEKEAKVEFQKWIRKRDSGKLCVSCGVTLSSGSDASHYFSAGQYSGMIFNEMNCHSSCKKCNLWLHGNLIEYRKGLIKRYGELYVQQLEEMAITKRNYKYTKEELINIREYYKRQNKLIVNNF